MINPGQLPCVVGADGLSPDGGLSSKEQNGHLIVEASLALSVHRGYRWLFRMVLFPRRCLLFLTHTKVITQKEVVSVLLLFHFATVP